MIHMSIWQIRNGNITYTITTTLNGPAGIKYCYSTTNVENIIWS